jgi:predicted dehydrogenase
MREYLSTAKIGREKVIPGLQAGKFCEVLAIASRNLDQAQEVANKLKILKAYLGSYEELLNDQDIDAVYIPPDQMIPLMYPYADSIT